MGVGAGARAGTGEGTGAHAGAGAAGEGARAGTGAAGTGAAPCSVSEESAIAEGLTAPHAIAIATSDTATMIVVDRDPGTLLAYGSRVATGARGIAIPVAGAGELFGIEALDGDRFVVITHARCPEEIASTRCLMAVLIGSDGRPIGAPLPIGLGGPLRTVRVVAAGDAVYVARSQALGAPELDAIRAGDAGLDARTLRLGDGFELREESTEILGVAVTGGSWAVLWRHGATEDARSGVVLSTQLDEHEVEALHDALVLESFQWYAGALSMIAAFEFARPRFVRMGADGEVRGEPRDLPVGQPLPAPFVSRQKAVILGSGEAASLEIRDGAGERVAEVPFGARGVLFADVARREGGFALAIARRAPDAAESGVSIVTREVTCRATARTAGAPAAPEGGDRVTAPGAAAASR